MKINELDTPVLLVDGDAFDRNMKRMQKIAADARIVYRPHTKAHKSPEIAKSSSNMALSAFVAPSSARPKSWPPPGSTTS